MISLIIRTFNNENLIKKAVESALNQSISEDAYEIIVINDGSNDNTKNILDSFSDHRLNIIHQQNKGMLEAAYIGMQKSRGDYVIFLDGDDEYTPDTLENLSTPLNHDSNIAFTYSDYFEVDLRNGMKKIVACNNILNILACGIMFRKEKLDEVGFWNNNLIFPEHDLILRLQKKYKGFHVAKPLYIYNRHPKSFTANKDKVALGRKQLEEKYGPLAGFKEY